jgi:hypothetical protein
MWKKTAQPPQMAEVPRDTVGAILVYGAMAFVVALAIAAIAGWMR